MSASMKWVQNDHKMWFEMGSFRRAWIEPRIVENIVDYMILFECPNTQVLEFQVFHSSDEAYARLNELMCGVS
jgi:hypothetical protein